MISILFEQLLIDNTLLIQFWVHTIGGHGVQAEDPAIFMGFHNGFTAGKVTLQDMDLQVPVKVTRWTILKMLWEFASVWIAGNIWAVPAKSNIQLIRGISHINEIAPLASGSIYNIAHLCITAYSWYSDIWFCVMQRCSCWHVLLKHSRWWIKSKLFIHNLQSVTSFDKIVWQWRVFRYATSGGSGKVFLRDGYLVENLLYVPCKARWRNWSRGCQRTDSTVRYVIKYFRVVPFSHT